MKSYLSLLISLLTVVLNLPNTLFSQSDFINHKKYWYYKTRLNSDFIKIGLDSGESIPFNQRGYDGANYQVFKPGQELRAGDATVQLGCYLAVLATEYRLLKDNGQDLTKIKHDIFCALNAVNRIDYSAEYFFSDKTQSGNLNGFFMRDDFPLSFVAKNYAFFNYYNTEPGQRDVNRKPISLLVQAKDKGFTQTFDFGMGVSEGSIGGYSKDLSAGKSKNQALNVREESQDQAYYLLMGLALTSKLVDDVPDGSNVFGYGSGETKLQTEAKNIAGRIINHMKSDATWRIRNPVNGNAFVQIGHDAAPYAYALDNLGCFIKHGQSMPQFLLNFQSIYPYAPCFDFSNVYSRSPIGAAAWHTVAYMNGGLTTDQMGFFNALAGSANCVYERANASNLVIQAGIDALQATIQTIVAGRGQQISAFLNGINMPPAVRDALQWVIDGVSAIWNAAQVAIDAAQAAYNHYTMAINFGLVMNTTDYRLYQNTKFANVNYFDHCSNHPNIPIGHTGSDAYFGIYLKDALRIDITNPNLPNWVQLIRDNVYNADRSLLKNNMEAILNSAPCNGNYNYDPNHNPGPNWGATNRIDRQDHLWLLHCANPTNSSSGSQGDFAGLDYLLLHNLFYLTEGTNSPISNYSERKISVNMPFTHQGTQVFSLVNKKTMGAFEYLTGVNQIASNGAADYRAGKEVALLDGFSSVSGSDFHAFISSFNGVCNNDEMMRPSGSSGNDDFFDGASDYTNAPKGNEPIKRTYVKNEYDVNLANEYKRELEAWARENTKNTEIYDLSSQITVYPNPNYGEFSINLNLKGDQIVNVVITDLFGRSIEENKNVKGYTNLSVNLKDLSKGVYLIKIIDQYGIENVKRITIQ
jgi:hypothetical protein